MKPQWWVKMRSMADEAIAAVKNGDVEIKPESAAKMYFRWLENINDWCISRQLYWGHQAPMYLILLDGANEEANSPNGDFWVSGRSEEEAQRKAEEKFPGKQFTLTRDPDVLDTWYVCLLVLVTPAPSQYQLSSGPPVHC